MKIKITTDSACDLSTEILEEYKISVIPLVVTMGNHSCRDGESVSSDDIHKYADATGRLPVTGAPNINEYYEFFRKWNNRGYKVIHVSIGSGFSSACQNACIAAQEAGNVWIIDSANLSAGQGLVALHAAEMAAKGCSMEKIVLDCREFILRVETSFVISDTDYLCKGGRCTALMSIGANVLKIKHCIEVSEGSLFLKNRYRGDIERAVGLYVERRLKGRRDIDTDRIFVTHTEIDGRIVDFVKELIMLFQPETKVIYETVAGATVTAHCGPGTLGVLFARKK